MTVSSRTGKAVFIVEFKTKIINLRTMLSCLISLYVVCAQSAVFVYRIRYCNAVESYPRSFWTL